ncbi:hypothetical protein COO60DRAFT_572992 [Scenedesmus sp. NREL 46B-D3]|nr:hypothetical protein COO60DRAFT_572992 [Scenedesmus sp. NREL 46B-D3]
MDCGEKADKGNSEMADCLPQFEQLHLCMEKNKAVFDSLLQEMKDEEELNKAAAGASSSDVSAADDSTAAVAQHVGSDQAVPAGMPTQQQEQHVADGSRASRQDGGVDGGAHAVQHDAVPNAAGSMAGAG